MHRNTLLVVAGLGVFAALVFGVNLGRRMAPSAPPSNVEPSITPTPIVILLEYKSTLCGVRFSYPDTLTVLESSESGAMFTNPNAPGESLALACQTEIPRVPLAEEKIEEVILHVTESESTISATLYHDASAKDGTPVDRLIFTHPISYLDVYLAGSPELLKLILPTLTLLP